MGTPGGSPFQNDMISYFPFEIFSSLVSELYCFIMWVFILQVVRVIGEKMFGNQIKEILRKIYDLFDEYQIYLAFFKAILEVWGQRPWFQCSGADFN